MRGLCYQDLICQRQEGRQEALRETAHKLVLTTELDDTAIARLDEAEVRQLHSRIGH